MNIHNIAEPILENLACGAIFVDEMGMVRFINRKAEEMLQVVRSSMLGKRVDMLPLRTSLYKVLSENCRDFPVELRINGLTLVVKATSVLSPAGIPIGELFEMHDITIEKRERRQREEFVAMMTHDLKSPLTVMMGYIHAMKGETLGKQADAMQECVEELDRSAHKMLAMIEDVLDSYRLEVGMLQIRREYSDLVAIVQGCCNDFTREAIAREIKLEVSISDPIPMMKIDGKQLSRVFTNLIGNAIKFTPRCGCIAVNMSIEDNHVLITVRDSGIGIAEKELSSIFKKYYRAEGARGFKGTGLGLTISKAITEAHGGAIEVQSVEGEGSTFRLLLPLEQR